METFLVLTPDEIKVFDQVIKEGLYLAIKQLHEEVEQKKEERRTYTINQVSKITKKGHATITKLCNDGLIKLTQDRKITQAALDDYLHNRQSMDY